MFETQNSNIFLVFYRRKVQFCVAISLYLLQKQTVSRRRSQARFRRHPAPELLTVRTAPGATVRRKVFLHF